MLTISCNTYDYSVILVQKVRMKWKSLRDSYRMKLYKKLQGTDNGQAWPFYVQMSFLEEHMRGRKNSYLSKDIKSMKRERENEDSNCVNSTTISYRNSLNNIEMVTVEDFDPSVLDSIGYSACETSVDSNRLEVSQPIKTMLPSTDMEEDRCFFESLLPYMKKLSPKDKMLCRMRIQEIVYSIAFPETPNKNGIKDDS